MPEKGLRLLNLQNLKMNGGDDHETGSSNKLIKLC